MIEPMMDCTKAIKPPRAIPCTARATIITPIVGASPAATEPTTNVTMAIWVRTFLLNRSDSLPQIGVVAVMVSRVATTTQV